MQRALFWARLALSLVLLAASTTLLMGFASSVPWIVLGFILLYAALLTASVASASKVRPHLLRDGSLLVKWGLHHEFAVPLASVSSIGIERPKGVRRAGLASDLFAVPGSGRELVVIRLDKPVAVSAGLGRQRLAVTTETILLPVDEGSPLRPPSGLGSPQGSRAGGRQGSWRSPQVVTTAHWGR